MRPVPPEGRGIAGDVEADYAPWVGLLFSVNGEIGAGDEIVEITGGGVAADERMGLVKVRSGPAVEPAELDCLGLLEGRRVRSPRRARGASSSRRQSGRRVVRKVVRSIRRASRTIRPRTDSGLTSRRGAKRIGAASCRAAGQVLGAEGQDDAEIRAATTAGTPMPRRYAEHVHHTAANNCDNTRRERGNEHVGRTAGMIHRPVPNLPARLIGGRTARTRCQTLNRSRTRITVTGGMRKYAL